MQGVDHVGAGIDDPETRVDALRLEETLLGTYEHRQMTEIVGNHDVKFRQVRHHNSPLRRLSLQEQWGNIITDQRS